MKMVSFVFLTLYDWPGRMDHKAASGKKEIKMDKMVTMVTVACTAMNIMNMMNM